MPTRSKVVPHTVRCPATMGFDVLNAYSAIEAQLGTPFPETMKCETLNREAECCEDNPHRLADHALGHESAAREGEYWGHRGSRGAPLPIAAESAHWADHWHIVETRQPGI